jgi:uncharacterized protein (DUF3820 family)
MTFAESKKFIMPFGKYKGCKLDFIAKTDEGLRYLDWFYGEKGLPREHPDVFEAIDAYMKDPTIAKEVDRVTG